MTTTEVRRRTGKIKRVVDPLCRQTHTGRETIKETRSALTSEGVNCTKRNCVYKLRLFLIAEDKLKCEMGQQFQLFSCQFGGKSLYVRRALLLLLLVIGTGKGEHRTDNCDVNTSKDYPNEMDVHCNCMQRLTQMNLNIAELTINQTGCPSGGLDLSWPDLETLVAPRSLVIVGANIFLSSQNLTRSWNSSITHLQFIDSMFEELPSDAFGGMDLLEDLKIISSHVGVVKENAISGLQQLKLVEIANSSVTVLEQMSFNNLPSLEDLAFAHCSIGSIQSEAIYINSGSKPETRCPAAVRTAFNNDDDLLNDIMGRSLSSTGGLPLPEYGTRFLLFKSNIKTLMEGAITSDAFGFLIAGGNHLELVETRAFKMELYNQCEISAAIFVGNTFVSLESQALAGISGRGGVSYQTFLAVSNNTFLTVANQGFLLSENLVIFTIDQNQFQCDCDKFDWILSDSSSQNQIELEKELVLKATCLDGSNLISFTSSCTDSGNVTEDPNIPISTNVTTTTGQPAVTTTPTVDPNAAITTTTGRPPVTASTSEPSSSIKSTGSVLSLITTLLFLFMARLYA